MPLTSYDIAQMIDLSAVQANDGDQSLDGLVHVAKEHRCYLVTALPSQILLLKDLLKGDHDIRVGGNVGFPSGGQTTHIKIAEARELLELGCDELDVVINIAKLVSGRYDEVLDELRAVVDAAERCPVKVILECHYLSEDQIKIGCDLTITAGAAFVKTGTGWAPTGATLSNITLIKSHVGDAIKIKASGGIRDIDTLINMYRCGACRFGVSYQWAGEILKRAAKLPRPFML